MPGSSVHVFRKDCFGATPKPTRETRALPGRQKHNRRFRIQVSSNSESRTCMAEAASPSSHSSFCEEVFSRTAHAGTNEADRTNILAPGFWSGSRRTHLLPAFTVFLWRQPYRLHNQRAAGDTPATTTIGPWEVVSQLQQRNCSRFARDFLRRSTFSSSQRTAPRSSGLRSALQDLFNRLCPRLVLLSICSSPAGLVSSAPISRSPCRKNFPMCVSQ